LRPKNRAVRPFLRIVQLAPEATISGPVPVRIVWAQCLVIVQPTTKVCCLPPVSAFTDRYIGVAQNLF